MPPFLTAPPELTTLQGRCQEGYSPPTYIGLRVGPSTAGGCRKGASSCPSTWPDAAHHACVTGMGKVGTRFWGSACADRGDPRVASPPRAASVGAHRCNAPPQRRVTSGTIYCQRYMREVLVPVCIARPLVTANISMLHRNAKGQQPAEVELAIIWRASFSTFPHLARAHTCL
jgi:hypothetical protein